MAQRNPFDNSGSGSGDGSSDDDESESEASTSQTSPVGGRAPPDDAGGSTSPVGGEAPPDDTDEPETDPGSSPAPPGGVAPPDDTDEPETDPGSSPAPPRGEAPPDDTDEPETDPGSSPAPPGGMTPPDDSGQDSQDDSQDDIDPGSSPAPPGGVAPPDQRPDGQREGDSQPEPREPDGIQSDRATGLRQEVAGQSDLFSRRDVTIERTDDGLRGFVPEQIQRQVLREEAASQTDVYGPADISIRETNGGFEAFVSDETEADRIQEQTADELGISESRISVEEREFDAAPPAGRTPPNTQFDVSIDTSGTRTVGESDSQTFDESQEQLENTLSDSDSITQYDVGSNAAPSGTDPTYDPGDQPQGLAETLIGSDTAQSVSSRGSLVSGSIVSGLQDAGAFIAEGQGADDAGLAGDVVGGGLEGRAEGAGEFVTEPIEGTRIGSATESAITGAFGTAPSAIAQAPGDVALLARRGEQAGRQVAADPGSAGDVATTAAGYGVAGASSSASAVANAPFREGAAIGALFLTTGGAAQGARATAQRVRSADVSVPRSVPDSVGRLARDERATAQVPRSQRTRQVDEPDEPMTIEGGDLADPSQMGRHVPEQRYGEYELGPSQPTRLEGMTERMGGRTTGPRSRTRRAQERQVRVGDPDLARASGAGVGVGSADVVADEVGRLERSQQRTVQLEMERSVTGIDSTTTTDTDVGQRIGIVPRQTTDQRAARVTTNVPVTTTDTPGGGTPNRSTPRTPRLPRLPDMPESDEDFGMSDTFEEEFGDVDVGAYIDPI